MKTLAIAEIKVTDLNARKTFDAAKHKELVASVKEKGILNPLLVRPSNNSHFELVCGERRLRAAKDAGLNEVPVIIRKLDDQQAMECMVIENLQREDVHPLEEAEGYEKLIKQGLKNVGAKPVTIEGLADKVGKSVSYIRGRLQLCSLIPENRKIFYDGKINASGALQLARVPDHLQKKAGQEIIRDEDDFPVPVDRIKRYIEHDLMMQLKEAQFDPKEKGLGGKISCLDCPKRTGNQPELFADIQGKDICTDPACFDAKKSAFASRMVENLRKQGMTVLNSKEAQELFRNSYQSEPYEKYYGMEHTDYDWPSGCTVGSMLKKVKEVDIKSVYAVHPHTGKVIRMINRSDLPKLLKAVGIKKESNSSGDAGERMQEAKKENRITETKRIFWKQKLSGMKDRRCLNAVLLYIALQEMRNSGADEFMKGTLKNCDWMSVEKLYGLGDEKVRQYLDKAAVLKAQPFEMDDEDMNFLCNTIGFSIAKDFVITKEYLEACTKEELLQLAKEFNISDRSIGDKKGDLVEHILKHAPKGKVPKELVK